MILVQIDLCPEGIGFGLDLQNGMREERVRMRVWVVDDRSAHVVTGWRGRGVRFLFHPLVI